LEDDPSALECKPRHDRSDDLSRAGATILGGLFVGLTRPVIVEFSFLLAVPTMLAATGYDLLKNASAFSSEDALHLAVGFVTSFIVALISIKWLIGYVQTRTFIPFGIYRILVAVVLGFVLYGSLLRS
jgi:undecaprenyl-diphosphatase